MQTVLILKILLTGRDIENLSEPISTKEVVLVIKICPINPLSLKYKKYIRPIKFEHKFYQASTNW